MLSSFSELKARKKITATWTKRIQRKSITPTEKVKRKQSK